MRVWLLLVTIGLTLVDGRIYNGKSRHERQAPDEFENQLSPVGESENFNPYEVVSVDGQSPVRYHHTECGIVLKEIAVLQPVNSDRDQFVLKRILIEKDTGKPASGPCAEALQASIDKEDAGKAPYEPPERIDGGVEPGRPGNNVIADLPYMSAPKAKREDEYKGGDYELTLSPDVEPPLLVEPPRDLIEQIDNPPPPPPQYQHERPSIEFRTHPGYRKGNKCSYKRQNVTVEETRKQRVCRRKDLPPLPPVVLPWCNTEKPWLNTAPCRTPPPPPEYKEFVRPVDEQMEIKPPPSRPRKCLHRARVPVPMPEQEIRPVTKPARCRNRGRFNEQLVPLPPANGHHNHLHHSNHNNELKNVDLVYENPGNYGQQPEPEPMIEQDDRKKREQLEPIPALPVYRI